eukprot:6186374-Pleurochrysis_carterae.AAC.1
MLRALRLQMLPASHPSARACTTHRTYMFSASGGINFSHQNPCNKHSISFRSCPYSAEHMNTVYLFQTSRDVNLQAPSARYKRAPMHILYANS